MILLFGATGMLGHYIQQMIPVIPIMRTEYDIETGTFEQLDQVILKHLDGQPHVIINCAGIIPQRTPTNDYRKYISVNTVFPHMLNQIALLHAATLIHITTDCVFNGLKGQYHEHSPHDETSLYGVSKSLGEPSNACIIRTSIIGQELNNRKSLLEWVRSKHHQTIDGYTNHLWNGITCLTLAKLIKQMMTDHSYWIGVRHIYSPTAISKYQLCSYINQIYQLGITIKPVETLSHCDKTLSSLYPPMFKIPEINLQIEEQKNYKEVNFV